MKTTDEMSKMHPKANHVVSDGGSGVDVGFDRGGNIGSSCNSKSKWHFESELIATLRISKYYKSSCRLVHPLVGHGQQLAFRPTRSDMSHSIVQQLSPQGEQSLLSCRRPLFDCFLRLNRKFVRRVFFVVDSILPSVYFYRLLLLLLLLLLLSSKILFIMIISEAGVSDGADDVSCRLRTAYHSERRPAPGYAHAECRCGQTRSINHATSW